MPFASEGTLTTDEREVAISETWDANADWNAAQSTSNVVVSNGVVMLEELTVPDSGNLHLHLDATELNLNDDDTVSSWGDVAGSNDASAVGGPTYQTGQQGGNPWVFLDGADDGFALSNRINELHNGSDWSLYIAWQRLGTGDQYVFGSGGWGSSDLGGGLVYNSGEDSHDRISDGSGFINPAQSGGYAGSDSFGVTSRVHDAGNSLDGWQDGSSVYSSGITGSYTAGDSDFVPHIGVNYVDQGEPLNAGLGEILFYDAAHDSETREDVESYLADKWGVSL